MRTSALTILLMLSLGILKSQTLYVHPEGNNNNSGEQIAPFASIQYALEQSGWDTLIVMDGIYNIDQPIQMKRSGFKDNVLVIKAQTPLKAIIDADRYILEKSSGKTPQRSGRASFHFQNVHFIKIEGIEVRNSHGMGIALAHGSSNIELNGCKVVNSYNSGIGLWYSDQVKVFNCEIIGANQIPMKTESDRAGREAPHEALTIAGATNFEVAYNEVHHCDKEGIDCKEVSSHGIIHHNYMHNLPRQGLYVDCWFGLLQDVEFCHNVVHNCEWGMAISGEGKDASMKNIRIHHNSLYDNRGAGIFFGVWGNDVARDSIFIYNNTIANNGSANHWAGPVGGIDICSANIYNTFIYNNICHNNYAYEIGCRFENEEREAWMAERNIVVINNHSSHFRSLSDNPGSYGKIFGFLGKESSEGDALLGEAPAFIPAEKSPARKKGWKKAPTGKNTYIGFSSY
jgi:hypothetical protein